MNTTSVTPVRGMARRARSARAAFTLLDTMTAMAIFSLVVIALVYSHLFSLRLFNISATKLSASAGARAALNLVRDEIRSGKTVYVGNGDNNGFTFIAANALHEGNALQIYPTASTNSYVRYYLDSAAQQLKRVVAGSTHTTVVARYVTNQMAFRAEDYAGNALTNNQNNRVIRMTLEFYQWEFPIARAGLGAYYDYYRLQTRITRRTIE
jgi:hypothetical protein